MSLPETIASERPALLLRADPVLPLHDVTFASVRDLIYQRTGIYYQEKKKYLLEGRLSKRVRKLGLPDYEAYLRYLQAGATSQEEWTNLYDAVTINETYFFRNDAQLDVLEQSLIPALVESKRRTGSRRIRVWSAASSSGEEAYSIGMLYLDRLRLKYPDLQIEIVASDISHGMLRKARQGVYTVYSIRQLPEHFKTKYFHQTAEGFYELSDEVKQLVTFKHCNLFDRREMAAMRNFDVVFCCNVMIYFDTRAKVQVVSDLYNSLNPGGHLFIGYAEALHGISTAFKVLNFPKTVVYNKE